MLFMPLLRAHEAGITNNVLIAASYISRFEQPLSQGAAAGRDSNREWRSLQHSGARDVPCPHSGVRDVPCPHSGARDVPCPHLGARDVPCPHQLV
jgi:hypothetical protein